MPLADEQIQQNEQAELNDKRLLIEACSKLSGQATKLLGAIDGLLLVASEKGYLLDGDRPVTDEDLVGQPFDAAAFHQFIGAVNAIATAAKSEETGWTKAIAKLVNPSALS